MYMCVFLCCTSKASKANAQVMLMCMCYTHIPFLFCDAPRFDVAWFLPGHFYSGCFYVGFVFFENRNMPAKQHPTRPLLARGCSTLGRLTFLCSTSPRFYASCFYTAFDLSTCTCTCTLAASTLSAAMLSAYLLGVCILNWMFPCCVFLNTVCIAPAGARMLLCCYVAYPLAFLC